MRAIKGGVLSFLSIASKLHNEQQDEGSGKGPHYKNALHDATQQRGPFRD